MSSVQLAVGYLCIAALVAGGAMVFAAWSHRSQRPARAVGVPAVLAGLFWPVVVTGLAQWLIVHAAGKMLRRQPQRTSEVVYYGPPARTTVKVG